MRRGPRHVLRSLSLSVHPCVSRSGRGRKGASKRTVQTGLGTTPRRDNGFPLLILKPLSKDMCVYIYISIHTYIHEYIWFIQICLYPLCVHARVCLCGRKPGSFRRVFTLP